MKKVLYFLLFLYLIPGVSNSQNYFRSGIFLHHSTGACIWGPNGSNTSVPQEMDTYNAIHGYTGAQAVTMNEEWWSPGDNEWATQHAFFEDPSPVTGIGYYLPGNKIIVIKTCFPASAMTGTGQPGDTADPYLKTLCNYKWHWRHIVRIMREHPSNFFAIWTNAPLEPGSTNTGEAALSKWFCTWAKDTLAAGLDPETGNFPMNVYVFDFFRKLTGPNGMMLSGYAAGPGDSHPNAAATSLVAPQFVNEIFDASIQYEIVSMVRENGTMKGSPVRCHPNPCRNKTVLTFQSIKDEYAKISLFDPAGRRLRDIADCTFRKGLHEIPVSLTGLTEGAYLIRWMIGTNTGIIPLMIVK